MLDLIRDIRSFRGRVQEIVDAGLNINAYYAGYTLIGRAIIQQQFEMAKELVAVGASLFGRIIVAENASDIFSDLVLHESANRHAPDEFLEYLSEAGADPNQIDYRNSLALSYTLVSHDTRVAKTLIRLGADPRRVDWDGNTLLHHAVSYGSSTMLRFLLEQGLDPNIPVKTNGGTLLHEACRRFNLSRSPLDDPHIVIDLLEFGADPQARDAQGMTPIDICRPKSLHQGMIRSFLARERLRKAARQKAVPK